MTHGSRTSIDSRYRRTILIAALIVIGVCLFTAAVSLSLLVPLPVEDESGPIEALTRLF